MMRIFSYGSGHGRLTEQVDLTFHVAHRFRDPHISPEMRQLDGTHPLVVDSVMRQPGAEAFIELAASAAIRLEAQHGDIAVAFECVGGRHRSVVFAEALQHRLGRDWPMAEPVPVVHRDIGKPVLERRQPDYPPDPPPIQPGFP